MFVVYYAHLTIVTRYIFAESFKIHDPESSSSFLIRFNGWLFIDDFSVEGGKVIEEIIIGLIFFIATRMFDVALCIRLPVAMSLNSFEICSTVVLKVDEKTIEFISSGLRTSYFVTIWRNSSSIQNLREIFVFVFGILTIKISSWDSTSVTVMLASYSLRQAQL